jgi:hypothetical protein
MNRLFLLKILLLPLLVLSCTLVDFNNNNCLKGWKKRNKYCYYLSNETLSRSNSAIWCNKKGSDLLYIEDTIEYRTLMTLIPRRHRFFYWTSLNRFKNDTPYKWDNGNEFDFDYTWYDKQILNETSNLASNCVALSALNIKLYTIDCNERLYFICKAKEIL